MEKNTINSGYVAVPDKNMSGTAVPGQYNKAWGRLGTMLVCAGIKGPDAADWLTARLAGKLIRQAMRLEERKKIRDAKRPAIRTVVW
jgi:hypothetical protein